MRTTNIRCSSCSKEFIVNVNKDFEKNNMIKLWGLPHCGHHTDDTRAGRRRRAKQSSKAKKDGQA